MGFRALPSIFAGNMKEILIRKALPGEEKEIHEAHMRSIREVCVRDHGVEEIKGWGNRPLENRWVDAIKTELVWVIEFNKTILKTFPRYLSQIQSHLDLLHIEPLLSDKILCNMQIYLFPFNTPRLIVDHYKDRKEFFLLQYIFLIFLRSIRIPHNES